MAVAARGPTAADQGESGFTGYKVENFRIIERPGQTPTRERFYWEYDMRPRKVLVADGALRVAA